MALGEGNYTFELGKYTSQVSQNGGLSQTIILILMKLVGTFGPSPLPQMVRVVKGVPKSLRSPHEMMGAQFEKRMDEVTVMRLITLHPLYTCLNDT